MFGQFLVEQVSAKGERSDVDRGRALLAKMRDERISQQHHKPLAGSHGGDDSTLVATLQAENDEMKLYLAAVVRMLVHKNFCTVDEIKQIVHALDSADGSVDGKMSGSIL